MEPETSDVKIQAVENDGFLLDHSSRYSTVNGASASIPVLGHFSLLFSARLVEHYARSRVTLLRTRSVFVDTWILVHPRPTKTISQARLPRCAFV